MSLVEQNSNTGKKAGIEAEELVEMSGVAEDKTSRRHNRKKDSMIAALADTGAENTIDFVHRRVRRS